MELVPVLFLFFLDGISDTLVIGQSIANRPRNTAAIGGSDVTLECTFTGTPEYVRWKEYITTSAGESIFSGSSMNPSHPRKARYNVNPTGGKYNLKISSLQDVDTGYYTCAGTDHENPKYGAYIMYLTPMTCSAIQNGAVVYTVVEKEEFVLFCQRNYSSVAGWPPVLNWIGLTADRNITTAEGVQYEVDMRADDSMNELTFSCRTSFTKPPPFKSADASFEDDTRLPANSEVDCNVTLQVHWAAKNFTFSPLKTEYAVGEEIKCSVSASPTPTYQWINIGCGETPTVVNPQILPITEGMLGNCTYACNVTNQVKGQLVSNFRTITFGVVMNAPQSLSPGAIAGIVIGCITVVAIIILVPVLIKIKCC